MQKTANQIKSEFENLASGHYQIHSFLYAQEFEQQAYENLIYPLMLVYPLGGSLSDKVYTRNYRVIIADRVLKSEGNELEVESDTQLIALDVLAYWMKLGQNERFSITSSNTITPFWEKWGDEVTGHFVDIGIEEFYDFNSCAIPLSGSIPTPPNPCKDARISVNSVVYGNAPSNSNFNVVVKDQDGALVGSLIGGEWIVNVGSVCADATYTIEDSLGNVLYTGTIPSGGSATEVIGNSTLNVNKSDGTLISSRSILAEGTDSYNVGDSSAVLKDESGNILSTTPIKATETEDIVAPNGDVSVNSVAFDDVLSGGTLNIEVLKSTGNDQIGSKQGQYWRIGDSTITNSDSTYDVYVKATENLVLPDSQINVNGVDRGDVVSVKTIDVNLEDSLGDPVVPTSVGLVGNTLTIEVPSGSTPSGVLFKISGLTSQRTQYSIAPNDDGALTQGTFYTSIVIPTTPKVISELDLAVSNYWFRLVDPLIVDGVSSVDRFVDCDGVQTFSATGNKNLVFIDKLTGYMWYRTQVDGTSRNFEDSIAFADAHSVVIDGVTYDDWVVPTWKMFADIFPTHYAANIVDGSTTIMTSFNGMATSSTDVLVTTSYIRLTTAGFASTAKGSTTRLFLVRKAHNLITSP